MQIPPRSQGEGRSPNLGLGPGLFFGPHPGLFSKARSLMECEISVLSVCREVALGHRTQGAVAPLQVETRVK